MSRTLRAYMEARGAADSVSTKCKGSLLLMLFKIQVEAFSLPSRSAKEGVFLLQRNKSSQWAHSSHLRTLISRGGKGQ